MTDEGTEVLKLANKVSDLLQKLAGPIAEEFGGILGDKARAYRIRNLVKTVRRTEVLLRDAGLGPNAVPPRLLLPIIEASSVEEDETLQEMWAGLLATASQQTNSVSPSFVETLKQLTPNEARHLERVSGETLKFRKEDHLSDGMELVLWAFGARHYVGPKIFDVPPDVYPDNFERLGLIRRNYRVEVQYEPPEFEREIKDVSEDLDYWFVFTEYAVRFIASCHGPAPQTRQD